MNISLPDLRKVKSTEWQAALFSVLATLGPGVLVVLQFKPWLFEQIEFGKLVLLALALTLPVVILNLLVSLPRALLHATPKMEDNELISFGDLYHQACLYAAVSLYGGVAAAYFLGLSFRGFCGAVAIVEGLLAAATWLNFWRHVER